MAAMVRTRFPLLGEPLALDLVNTRVLRGGRTADLLSTPQTLNDWLRAESARLPWRGNATRQDVESFRILRDAVTSLLAAHRTGTAPDPLALATLNRALTTGPEVQLGWGPSGAELTTGSPQRLLALHLVAFDAVELLTGPERQLVRTCEHPECVLQFLARNPRRRGCSSTRCGNRARVARNYTRHHTR